MPTPTIPAGNLFMNATLYTGTGATQTITNGVAGQAFQPDLVWLKQRSSPVAYHLLYDSNRGVGKWLSSNATSAEGTIASSLTAFNSNGFSVGADPSGADNGWNASGLSMVGWQWKAGGTAVTNTSGTISSQVSANTTSGFSVVTYTGTGANATVGHGLGVAPSMIIVKARNVGTQDWQVYHTTLGINQAVQLNSTSAASSATNYWYNGITSTVFGVNGSYAGINGNTNTYIAYCWTPIAGYSAFGSYTGNGSTDGPFIYTGFRPRFFMYKDTTNVNSWVIFDSSRDTYNIESNYLIPNSSAAEGSTGSVDFLSNGFKIRFSGGSINTSSATIIYAAFAENPFKYSNAR